MKLHWEALDQVVDDLDEATVKQDKYKFLENLQTFGRKCQSGVLAQTCSVARNKLS